MPRLWFGFLGPPVIWAARFGASYALVPAACGGNGLVWMQILTATALAGTAWAGVVASGGWRSAGDAEPGGSSGARLRNRLMAAVGILGSTLFFLVIVAEALPLFLVHPCQTGGVPL